jgi:cellulose synthase operon protein C
VRLWLILLASGGLFAQAITKNELSECEALRHHGDPSTRACYERLTHARDAATRAEGYWGAGDYSQANEEFIAAVKASPKDAKVWTRRGRMFLERYQPADATDWFNNALAADPNYAPAILGQALVAADGFEGNAADLAQRALRVDPKLFEAHELLARIALEDGNEAKAKDEAGKALDISNEALDAMAILATIDLLDDREKTPWMDRVLKINPSYGEAYAITGHFFFINRRYEEEITAYRKAIELTPDLWNARSELGVVLMQTGNDVEARKLLEECYNAGYKSPATVNTLKLLDTFRNYQTFKTPTTVLRLQNKEADLLRPYFQSELDRAIATYTKKYHYKLPFPVQVEVYPNHEDFAVRTMGMPGIGALGVTFGNYIAMDSPNSRPPGQFHWDSTMWHELSHVFVLSMTKNRVPRWFTEGLAVYEETGNGNPDWGDRLDPEVINAIKMKRLLPIAELDRGYIHPSYPAQVTVSYFQGGKICEFIAGKWGYDKLLAMIHDFGELTPTVDVIQKEFEMKPEEFDKQFFAWLDAQTHTAVNGFDEWKTALKGINAKAKEKQWDDVIKEGTRIRDIYADYVEVGNVYEFLSEAYLAKGDKDKATAELERYAKIGGRDPETLKQLAKLQSDAGRKKDAAATLERLNLIYPRDEAEHKMLGDLYMGLADPNHAAREFRAMIACNTVDPAGAHYSLAVALKASNRLDEAREEVLSALEAAPEYRPAQKLLLELNVKQ